MRTISSLFMIFCLALPLAACGAAAVTADSPAEAFKRISAADLNAKLAAKDALFVFDDNGDERFTQGHIPTAKHLKADAVIADALPADKAAMLVFYCGSDKCTACHHAAEAAIALGYSNVWIMPDGIKGWEEQKFAVD